MTTLQARLGSLLLETLSWRHRPSRHRLPGPRFPQACSILAASSYHAARQLGVRHDSHVRDVSRQRQHAEPTVCYCWHSTASVAAGGRLADISRTFCSSTLSRKTLPTTAAPSGQSLESTKASKKIRRTSPLAIRLGRTLCTTHRLECATPRSDLHL